MTTVHLQLFHDNMERGCPAFPVASAEAPFLRHIGSLALPQVSK